MNCLCGYPARYLISRDGRPAYNCPLHRCKFFALAPVQCEGYHRVVPTTATPSDAIIVRFEAAFHPETKATAAQAVCQLVSGNAIQPAGGATGGAASSHGSAFSAVVETRLAAVRAVLEDAATGVQWHCVKEAYLYPMSSYQLLLLELRRLPGVLVEEVPFFFFRSVEQTRLLPEHFAEAVRTGRESVTDPDDIVYTQLRPFQQRGVDFIVQHGGRGMIADDMGLGKTVQAIAVAHHYRAEWPVLVVCPMSLMENWAKEFNRFCGLPFSRMVVLQGAKATASSLHEVVIVSYASLKCVEGGSFNVVILDESHYIKAGDAKRAQLALRLCKAARRVVLLSGTPAMSRPIELFTQLQAIHPTAVPSKTQYGARYCNSYVSRFGVDLTGHSHTDELHCLLQHFVIRRTKRELGTELPSKTRQLLYVYITEKEKKALEKQVLALRRTIATHPDGTGLHAGGDLTTRAPNAFELKIATARAKIPAVQDYVSSVVEQHLDSGEKVIFFAHHQCMMEAIKTAVEAVRPKQPVDFIYITGDTAAAQREQLADHFRNEPSCSAAILSMQSSGTGHNFTCASTVVFAELDWNPSTHLQCEDRVHRMGQENPCTIKYLLAEGTSDSVVWPMLQTKLTVTTAMLESSDGGEDSTRKLLGSGADTRKVSRRDVSPVACSSGSSNSSTALQSTLDGFLRPSQPSQKQPRLSEADGGTTTVQVDEDCVTENAEPAAGHHTPIRSSPLPARVCGDSLNSTPRRTTAANLVAARMPQPPHLSSAPQGPSTPSPASRSPQVTASASSTAKAAKPVLISIAELQRQRASTGSVALGTRSFPKTQTPAAPALATTMPNSTFFSSSSVPSTPPAVSVLDMMKGVAHSASPGGKENTATHRDEETKGQATPPQPAQVVAAKGSTTVVPATRSSEAPVPVVSPVAMALANAAMSPPSTMTTRASGSGSGAAPSRRTTFTLSSLAKTAAVDGTSSASTSSPQPSVSAAGSTSPPVSGVVNAEAKGTAPFTTVLPPQAPSTLACPSPALERHEPTSLSAEARGENAHNRTNAPLVTGAELPHRANPSAVSAFPSTSLTTLPFATDSFSVNAASSVVTPVGVPAGSSHTLVRVPIRASLLRRHSDTTTSVTGTPSLPSSVVPASAPVATASECDNSRVGTNAGGTTAAHAASVGEPPSSSAVTRSMEPATAGMAAPAEYHGTSSPRCTPRGTGVALPGPVMNSTSTATRTTFRIRLHAASASHTNSDTHAPSSPPHSDASPLPVNVEVAAPCTTAAVPRPPAPTPTSVFASPSPQGRPDSLRSLPHPDGATTASSGAASAPPAAPVEGVLFHPALLAATHAGTHPNGSGRTRFVLRSGPPPSSSSS